MQERRKFIRLILDPAVEIKVKIIPSNAVFTIVKERKVLIRNLSVSGGLLMGLAIKDKEEEDELLSGKEKIYFGKEFMGVNFRSKVLGKLVWLKKTDKPGYLYEAGVAFENITESDKENILHAMIDLAFKQKIFKGKE